MKIFILCILFLLNVSSLITSDWKHIKKLNTGRVNALACWDSVNCFCQIQQTGFIEIYNTSDAGKSWKLKYKSDYNSEEMKGLLNAEKCVSPHPNYYYAIFWEGCYVAKSTDGAKTFKRIKIAESATANDIVMLDSNTGTMNIFKKNQIGSTFYITYDGWETFIELDSIYKANYIGKEFSDRDNLQMIYGSRLCKLVSHQFVNFNLKEKKITPIKVFFQDTLVKYRDAFFDMSIINDSVTFLVGSRGMFDSAYRTDVIYRTKDKGKNWQSIHDKMVEPRYGLSDIAFYDSKNGVAVGQYGKIVTTNDGGDTWVYNDLPPEMLDEEPLTMKVAWAGKTPIIGTWDGNMYRYEGDFFNFVPVPKPVNLIRPTNNAVKLKNDKAEFSWFSDEGYKKFYFQLSDSPDFAKFIRNDTLNTANLTVTNFESYSNYFWRVAFKFDKKVIWSDTYTFRTGLQKTTTSSPECGAKEQDFTVKFNWQSVKGAEKYRIRLSKNSKFGTITHEKDEILDLETEIPNLDELTTYFWQVQPYRSDETGDWSNVCSFTTKKSTSVANTKSNDNILVSPNPASDYITIQTSEVLETSEVSKVQIFNTLGIEVISTPSAALPPLNEGNLRIDISNLPIGVYFVRITGSNGACSIVEKFVKI